MRPKVSVFIATSLDGFIARKDGNLDWLDEANKAAPSGEDCGYHAFMASVDILVMGRHSFEKVLSFGQWPYEAKPVLVLSSKKIEMPERLPATVSSSSETPEALVQRLSTLGVKHIYIDGGVTIQRFLEAKLVDELTLTLVPVLLGEGKPLFGGNREDLVLKHLETKTFEFGYVQLKYRVGVSE